MTCPCCTSDLQPWVARQKFKCEYGHIFTLDFAPEGRRVLIVEETLDQCCPKGTRYPIPDDAIFD